MAHRFLRKPELLKKLSMKREALRAAIADGLFPPGVPIFPGGRAQGWLEDEVDAYIERRRREGAREEKGSFPEPKDPSKGQQRRPRQRGNNDP